MTSNHFENSDDFASLNVNKGIEQPPIVNPYLQRTHKRKKYSVNDYVEGIRRGDISMLSQAVTLIESQHPDHYNIAQEVIEKCLPHSGNAIRVGITGVPGAGKSTFCEALGLKLCKENHRLAVLAIDPSSERTKGSILGDKTRMEQLSIHPNAFIRPSPSAGSLGGVARKTRESIILCEAAGFDTIFVETVGVGQSETAMHSMVDFFLLIQLAGTGDELQGIKRGIMEMADGITINKCDGTNVDKANLAKTQFTNALHLFPMPESGWTPQVTTCSAFENINIDNVWKMITDYIDFTKANNFFNYKRQKQGKYWMYETIDEQLKSNFYNNETIISMLQECEVMLNNKQITSFAAAHQLLETYKNL